MRRGTERERYGAERRRGGDTEQEIAKLDYPDSDQSSSCSCFSHSTRLSSRFLRPGRNLPRGFLFLFPSFLFSFVFVCSCPEINPYLTFMNKGMRGLYFGCKKGFLEN